MEAAEARRAGKQLEVQKRKPGRIGLLSQEEFEERRKRRNVVRGPVGPTGLTARMTAVPDKKLVPEGLESEEGEETSEDDEDDMPLVCILSHYTFVIF